MWLIQFAETGKRQRLGVINLEINVACLQLTAYDVSQSDLALDNALMMIDKAALRKPDLVVLPECTFPGYVLGLYDDVEEQVSKTAVALKLFRERANMYNFYLAVGLAETFNGKILNTAVLIGPDGEITGRVAKSFLWHFDTKWFAPDNKFETFDTEIGRVGMMVCADGRQPEIARMLSLKGAEIIIDLTNLVTSGNRTEKLSNQQCEFMLPARAIENDVWIIVANKVGSEASSVVYCGKSCVISPDGSAVKIASTSKQEIIFANIRLGSNNGNDIKESITSIPNMQRRPEIYKIICDDYECLPISKILDEKVVPENCAFYGGLLQINKNILFEEFVKKINTFTHRMVLQSARLLVLPDISGAISDFNGKAFIDNFCEMATKGNIYLIATGVSSFNKDLYRTAYLFCPDGSYKHYYKTHLEESEKREFTAGDKLAVWKTDIGNIGIMLGHEGFFPEIPRCLTLMGADIIAWPIDLATGCYQLIAKTRASENRIYMLVANTCGSVGSMIINPLGLVQVSSFPDREQAIGSYIEVSIARNKNVVPGSNVIKDRAPYAYKSLCL